MLCALAIADFPRVKLNFRQVSDRDFLGGSLLGSLSYFRCLISANLHRLGLLFVAALRFKPLDKLLNEGLDVFARKIHQTGECLVDSA